MKQLILSGREVEQPEDTNMHKCDYFMEAFLSGLMAVIAYIGHSIMAIVDPEQADSMRWFFIPIIGACLASLVCFLLNPKPEDRRTVSGRVLAAICFSIGGAWVSSVFVPWVRDYMQDPRAIGSISFLVAMFMYFVSRSTVVAIIKRSDRIAGRLLDVAEKRTLGKDDIGTNTSKLT